MLNYRIIIEKEHYEDGSLVYVAYCPTLGISDYGDTVENVLASIKDGIELAIESLAKEGKKGPVDHVLEQIETTVKIPFVKTKIMTVSANDEIPNDRTLAIMKQAEKKYKEGNTSPAFKTVEEVTAWMKKQGIL